VLEIHRDVARDQVLSLLESCGYLVDSEPIDDTMGAFADPQSNASFIFQANPFAHAGHRQPATVKASARCATSA
jgi:hypothetical protein